MVRREFAGLSVVIENPAGSTRQWHDREGRESGSTLMRHDYGFLEDHVGSDGDELDCYLGPDEAAKFVYVVHQLKAPEFSARDEDKCFLGFASEAAAKEAYLAHRNDGDRAYGGMSAIPLDDFKRKLERRTGSGKIRHEVTMLIHGDGQAFEVPRDESGKLRTGQWDRGMTPGVKEKEGQTTEFSPRTFAEMIGNWKRRGEPLSLCYNHQSAYAKENGQPAPALAFYDAVCVVDGGQVVQFEKLGKSTASPPDVDELGAMCTRLLATDENPQPSADGCWWYRCEHTDLGEQLLGNFKFLSPMFVANGADEQGNEIGYVIYDLAATNTAFQGGCMINFDATHAGFAGTEKGAGQMAKLSKLAKFVKMEESADDEKVKEAVLAKMEDEAKMAMESEEYNYDDAAGRLEEMAKHYEDAKMDEKEGDEPPHVVMRRMAAKFRRMTKMADDHKEPDGDEGKMEAEKDKEAAKMERALCQQYSALANRLDVKVPSGASSAQMFEAIKAAAVPASQLPTLVDAQVKKALLEAEVRRTKAETEARAKTLVQAAVEGGYPEAQKDALLKFASDPASFSAAEALARPFLGADKAQLFSRMTQGGAPTGVNGREGSTMAGPDRRIVTMSALGNGAKAVVFGEALSKEVSRLADSQDAAEHAKIDAELPEGTKGTKYESFERYMAAERITAREKKYLVDAANEDSI